MSDDGPHAMAEACCTET